MSKQKSINFSWALNQESNKIIYRICGQNNAWWKQVHFENMHNAIFEKNGVLELWTGSLTASRSKQRGTPKFVAIWIENESWALLIKAPNKRAAIVPQHYLEDFEKLKRSESSSSEKIEHVLSDLDWLYENAESHEWLDDLTDLYDWKRPISIQVGVAKDIAGNHPDPLHGQETVVHEVDTIDELDSVDFDEDLREKILGEIIVRRGQPAFRDSLLSAYEYRCAISGCDVEDALEAAHIIPYKGEHSNAVCNGILLRADLHTLFDTGLITIDPKDMSVRISESIKNSFYADLHGAKIRIPKSENAHPSRSALSRHAEKYLPITDPDHRF